MPLLVQKSLPRLLDEERKLKARLNAINTSFSSSGTDALDSTVAASASVRRSVSSSNNNNNTRHSITSTVSSIGEDGPSAARPTSRRESLTGRLAPIVRPSTATGGLVVSTTDRFTTYPYRPAALTEEIRMRETGWGDAALAQTGFAAAALPAKYVLGERVGDRCEGRGES
jgi:hypothetical protein